MDKEHKQLRSTAKRWPRFWLWVGFGVLSFQVGLLILQRFDNCPESGEAWPTACNRWQCIAGRVDW